MVVKYAIEVIYYKDKNVFKLQLAIAIHIKITELVKHVLEDEALIHKEIVKFKFKLINIVLNMNLQALLDVYNALEHQILEQILTLSAQ